MPREKKPRELSFILGGISTEYDACIIRFHSDFTIDDLQAYISDGSIVPDKILLAIFDEIRARDEYIVNLLLGQFGEDGGIQTLAALSGLMGTFGDPHVASLMMNEYAMSSFVPRYSPLMS